jgi:hypothetical protein
LIEFNGRKPAARVRRRAGRTSLISLTALLFAPAAALAQALAEAGAGAKSVEIPQLADRPTIDGVLDEDVWSHAALVEDFHQVLPEEYGTPTEPTQVRIFYTQDALYIGARMVEADAGQMTDRVLRQG